jgi:putative ABC transport system permease protein
MMRLVLSDLFANARVWLGMLLLTLVVGMIGGLAAGLIETGISYGGAVQEGLVSISATVALFAGVTAVTVLSSSASLTVTLQQRGYALWQLVGIPPLAIGAVVIAQLLVVAVLGAVLGALVALPVAQPFFDYIFATWPDLHGVRVRFGPTSMAAVIVAATGVVVLGGLRGARQASRGRAIDALREPEPRQIRMGWVRWVVASALAAGLLAVVAGLDGADVTAVASQAMFLTPLIIALLAALGPVLYPLVLTGWTALVPRRASASWFLARHTAGYRISQSTAAIGPLMVGVGLTGGVYTAASTLAGAVELQTGRTTGYDLAPEGVVILLGGPLLLAAVAAAAAVFMSGRARDRDSALLRAAGAGSGTVLAAAAWEAVIYLVTAVLLGGAAIAAGGFLTAWALGTTVPGVTATFAVVAPALVAGCGLVLVLAATVIPTVTALRIDVASALAAE